MNSKKYLKWYNKEGMKLDMKLRGFFNSIPKTVKCDIEQVLFSGTTKRSYIELKLEQAYAKYINKKRIYKELKKLDVKRIKTNNVVYNSEENTYHYNVYIKDKMLGFVTMPTYGIDMFNLDLQVDEVERDNVLHCSAVGVDGYVIDDILVVVQEMI